MTTNSHKELESAIAHLERAANEASAEGCGITSLIKIAQIICSAQDMQKQLADEAEFRLKRSQQIPENL